MNLIFIKDMAPTLLLFQLGNVVDFVMGSRDVGALAQAVVMMLSVPLTMMMFALILGNLSAARLYASLPVRRADVVNAYWLMIGGFLLVYLVACAIVFYFWPGSENMMTTLLAGPPAVVILAAVTASIIMSWMRRRAVAGAAAKGATALAVLIAVVLMVGSPFAIGIVADAATRRVALIVLLAAGALAAWTSNQRTYARLEQ